MVSQSKFLPIAPVILNENNKENTLGTKGNTYHLSLFFLLNYTIFFLIVQLLKHCVSVISKLGANAFPEHSHPMQKKTEIGQDLARFPLFILQINPPIDPSRPKA